ncbi:MAG: FKBP-type peptidyl-prolyl cis-trans isomerase [Saprospiraceae bacterium]
MRKFLFLFFVTLFIGACGTKKIVEAKPIQPVQPAVPQPAPLMNEIDSISYAFGLFTAQTFKQIQEDSDGKYVLNVDHFSEGIKEMLDDSPRLSEEAKEAVMQEFSIKMQSLASEKQKLESIKIKEEGIQFLAANAKKEGVQTTASGLQYKVIKEGDGISPKATDKVSVHYVGTLLDGSTFDSSRVRGEPISFGLDQVIQGWTEGVQLMKVGSTYEFFIPSELAYGEEGNQGIPGGSVLKFEVELLGIE